MAYIVRQHQDGRAVSQTAQTAKEAVALGQAWASERRELVNIQTPDGDLIPLYQFKANLADNAKVDDR